MTLPGLALLPVESKAAVEAAWWSIEAGTRSAIALSPEIFSSLATVWACSNFVLRASVQYPEWIAPGDVAGRMLVPSDLLSYRARLREELSFCSSEAELMASLRRFRKCEMVRLAWRDIAGWTNIEATLRETSLLGEAIVSETLSVLFNRACAAFGTPVSEAGAPQLLNVIAMGKLGAWELNFSSDIDLIFAYRAEGVLDNRRAMSYAEFYTRLACRLIQTLDQLTEDGFVFRVDMRLRPFGESGPLAINLEALEIYLQSQAREWERYAMVKARVIAGDVEAGDVLQSLMRSFVYRRYLDYRAFGELRALKKKITAEVQRRDRQENIKLGPGGIREIEFIVQVFQLIRGGCEAALRDRRLVPTLAVLAEQGHLPAPIARKLTDAYTFLRTVENRLQEYDDQQTHDLPQTPTQQKILALSLGLGDWVALRRKLDDLRRQTHEVFEQVMSAPHTEGEEQLYSVAGEPPTAAWLESIGFGSAPRAQALLKDFGESRAVKRLTSRGAADLNRVMPLALRAVATTPQPETALERLLALFEAVASRSVYFALLAENPLAVSQLVKFATASPWIIHYITQFPVLLDELLDPRALYRPLSREELSSELAEELRQVDAADLEQLMVAFRHFKQANLLRVAATDIMGITPIMVVSDYLSYLAETLVGGVLQEAWRITTLRHGVPPNCHGPEDLQGFGVVAYGKLGGLELGYGSDLDLVFLHNAPDATALTGGNPALTLAEFYARVAKRMVTLMTTQTHAGALYEIDLRLRPSGNSGLLVSSVDAYEVYQRDLAWTWEQQSLVRARFIAGDSRVGERFSEIRHGSLIRRRDRAKLRVDVVQMREKMRRHLGHDDPDVFDLKQGVGGIADIEFIVQFGILATASDYPSVTRWSDVVRLLDELSEVGFLSSEDADMLRQAYCHYRAQVHHCALQEVPPIVPADENQERSDSIRRIWQRIMQD